MSNESPSRIGKYEILSTLGHGGMGVVYRAHDPRMGKQVAIKTVTEGFSKEPGALQRFYREAQRMGMLEHPNIVTVYDLGEQDGFPFIVMEYVEGVPLDRIIQSNEPYPLVFKLRIIEQMCAALGYAHHNDVVHRDVKPANVIVRPDGVAKLLDFGIARQEKNDIDLNLTVAGGVIGTVPYMAPERLKGTSLNGRSDIFATGVLMYQLLTGELPFRGEEIVLVNKLLNEKPPPMSEYIQDYPRALDAIVDRALEKDPADRYQTAEEMAGDLFSVIEVLKKEYSSQMIVQAEKLSTESNFVGARDVLMQLLKLDNQHTQARRMLAEMNQHLTLKERAEQAQQKRCQAEDLLAEKKYDEALRLLEEASRLVPGDRSYTEQLTAVRARKETADQIIGYLQQADAAKKVGDYRSAQSIVEKALKLDTNNSRLRATYLALIKQAEEAALKAKVKTLLDAAKKEMQQRRYADALALIGQAAEFAPADQELQDIRTAAKDGLFQAERRKLLNEVEEWLNAATSREEVERVASMVRGALEKMPSDPTLLRYQMQLDGQMREFESKALVDATVNECLALMDAAPLQAFEKVRKVLLEVPGDERLIALESSIQDRLARQTEEEARTEILLRAREALTQRRFAEAVIILEQCSGSLRTEEITELLDFAREESAREQQQSLIAHTYAEAHNLHREGKYEAVVQLLQPVLQRVDDTRLRKMLAEAEKLIGQLQSEEEAALNYTLELVETDCHEQAVAFVQRLPDRIAGNAEIKLLRVASEEAWKQQCARLEKLGQSYAALESPSPLDKFDELTADAVTNGSLSKVLQAMTKSFEARRTALMDAVLTSRMQTLQAATASEDAAPSPGLLAADPHLLTLVSPEVLTEWLTLVNQYKPQKKTGKIFSRLTGKRS